MAEDREQKQTRGASAEPAGIEQLLADRQKIDEELKAKFSQDVTVMFTDIKGSTSFFESYGDIEGRLMVQKHNDLLFPVVQKFGGRVIKTIGDAIMAAFDSPEAAVRAGIEMQSNLQEHNRGKKDKKDQIHVRIGINTGEGLVEKSDIFGDVVNVAARVESLTEPDEILVSAPVYDQVRSTDDIICRYAQQTRVKGKEEPMDVYRVIWAEEECAAGVTRGAASAAKAARKRAADRRRLEIDISRDGTTIKVSAAEKSRQTQSTIRPYEEMQVSMVDVDQRCSEITQLLNRANTRGKVSKDILNKLRDVGNVLFDMLLTAQTKDALRKARVDDLIFHIEDSLVQIPWELLYDGDQFLCQKFNMGRLVKTRRQIYDIRQRSLSRPLKMLIVSDPRGDLANSSKEGRAIREHLDRHAELISANQRSGQITTSYLMEKIRNFDIVHYAGHADYDHEDPSHSGWLLAGGKFTSADIVKLAGGRPMPALVFCNACQSGQTEEWKLGAQYSREIFGLANAFLLAGVQHYIGTFWEILDEPGAHFAEAFYRSVLDGATIGEAVRQARAELIKQHGEDTIVWASYMLYGDPGMSYCDFDDEQEAEEPHDAQPRVREAAQVRGAPSDVVAFETPQPRASRSKYVIAAAAAIVACAAALLLAGRFFSSGTDPYSAAYAQLQAHKVEDARKAFSGLAEDDPRRYEGLAAVRYELGDYDGSFTLSSRALEIAPHSVYAHVLQGRVLLSRGREADALQHFQAAAGKSGGISWQKAEALNGIARIWSEWGDTQKAMQFYARAAELNPRSPEIVTNRAFAMQKTGNTAGAVSGFKDAAGLNPQDPYASVFLAEALKKQKAEQDSKRRERIDKLVDELAENFDAGGAAAAQQDTWTSRPLTLSFINITGKGAPAQREGADEFFLMQLSALLQGSGRAQVVERELLEQVLQELKLSATDLVNPDTAVRLGRILSARVIATGSIMRYSNQIQVSLRLTDTETTALKGVIAESGTDPAELARQIAGEITQQLTKAYPIRGSVVELDGNQLLLDIGSALGVTEGMEFTVLDEVRPESGGRMRLRPLGTARIASVAPEYAYAEPSGNSGSFKPGLKVKQLVQ